MGEKRRMSKEIKLRLTDEIHKKLAARAKKNGVRMTDQVRFYISIGLRADKEPNWQGRVGRITEQQDREGDSITQER